MDEHILKGGLPEGRRNDLTRERVDSIADELVATGSLHAKCAIDQCGLTSDPFA